MHAVTIALALFFAFFGAIYGMGSAVVALLPRCRGVSFFINTLTAAAGLALASACVLWLANNL